MGDYTTIAEVRAEGFSDVAKYPDPLIQGWITLFSRFIEDATKQWFESKNLTVVWDGNDGDTLFFPVPIISVTSLQINGVSGVFDPALPSADYVAYTGRALPDDRRNPRIKLITARRNIFTPPQSTGRRSFINGYQNQRIIGSFGYTESDGSTPVMIKYAVKKMVCIRLRDGGGKLGSSEINISGPIVGEITDGHAITYDKATDYKMARPGWDAITKDPELTKIIAMYRSPLKIAVPKSLTIEKG